MKLIADLRLTTVLLISSILIMLLDSVGLLQLPKSLIQTVVIPIEYGVYKTGLAVAGKFAIIGQARRAAQQNSALRQQMADLLAENADLRRKLAEALAYVEQQDILDPKTYNLLPARPIGLGRYLIIDRGSDDGLAVGQAVVFKNEYIGQIKELSAKNSTVLLALDPDSKIAVFSQNANGRARGILGGQFGSEGLMDKILHNEPIEVDDLIYSEGTEGRLPKGLIMGKVTEVMERPNEVFKQAKVKPIFNILDLDVVFIVRN